MSSGRSDYMSDQSAIFDQIVQRYKHTIAAQFYGHTHQTSFEIGYSDYGNRDASTATSISHTLGSLTPMEGNPIFRVYEIDPDSFAVMDFVDVYANVSDPGYQQGPQWKPYYSAREAYGKLLFDLPLSPSEPLSPSFWHRVTEVFEQDQSAFLDFMRRRNGGAFEPKCHSWYCRTRWIQSLRAARSEYNGEALQQRQSAHVWKRDGMTAASHESRGHGQDLPNLTGCSSRTHNAANLLKSMVSMPGAKQVSFHHHH